MAAMTLRLQINLIVGALTLLFTAAVIALQLSALRDSVHEEVVAANRVASQLLLRTAGRSTAPSAPQMFAYLQGVGRIRSNDITLLDAQGRELYRSPPSPYKAGRDAPPWFEALMAPPPSVQAIALPDGKLEVRANASRAALDAWDYLSSLAGGALLWLVAVNLLVFWLVGRALRPLRQIVGGLDQLQAGRFDVALPPLPGSEARAIGAAFNRMVVQVRDHIETERRALRAEIQLSDSRDLTHWIDRHIEAERRAIARELHDELGQSVTAMRSLALSIVQRSSAADADVAQAARVIADEASRLYDAMHGIIPRLTPLVLDNFGLGEALSDLQERTRRSQPEVAIELQVDAAALGLPAEIALALYRSAQEGLTNALRHGRARHVKIEVTSHLHQVRLALRDDGVGLPVSGAERAGHYGLRWLTERVESLNGVLKIEAVAPHGVLLEVSIPLLQVLA